ncbi:MAG: helix-hairpin-helix domain-containing protein [Phycisphaerae bacterium]|nr:MAG: helix-hairpin-helix domain-containing protein [Phycisphaerae bacterium]
MKPRRQGAEALQQPDPANLPAPTVSPASPPASFNVALGIVLAAILLHAVHLATVKDDPPPPGTDRALCIDPNRATWTELAVVPGLGPVRALTIVRHRQSLVAASSSVAFRNVSALDPVAGVGPATIEDVRRYLRFTDDGSARSTEADGP